MGSSSSSNRCSTISDIPADLGHPSKLDEDSDLCQCCADDEGGMFRGFCPPPKNKRSRDNRWSDDPIGTPVQDTPPNIRRMRMQMENMGVMSSRYEGLEKETSMSTQKTSDSSGGTASFKGKFGAVSPTADYKKSSSAEIHEGKVSLEIVLRLDFFLAHDKHIFAKCTCCFITFHLCFLN